LDFYPQTASFFPLISIGLPSVFPLKVGFSKSFIDPPTI
jgi:hypothetical protein